MDWAIRTGIRNGTQLLKLTAVGIQENINGMVYAVERSRSKHTGIFQNSGGELISVRNLI
jgi:hypothetical protein